MRMNEAKANEPTTLRLSTVCLCSSFSVNLRHRHHPSITEPYNTTTDSPQDVRPPAQQGLPPAATQLRKQQPKLPGHRRTDQLTDTLDRHWEPRAISAHSNSSSSSWLRQQSTPVLYTSLQRDSRASCNLS